MAFFSFELIKEPITHLSKQIKANQNYFSKDITLWKELKNRNKNKQFCLLKHENRSKITIIGKKLLICLPPKFGLGDAVEYGIALYSLIKSQKFNKVGIAFCSNHNFIFEKLFKFKNIYPFIISEEEIKKYDTIIHITLEIESLKFQKYQRSNIALEVCKYFSVPLLKFKNFNYKKTTNLITIFPVSTSAIRSMPFKIIRQLAESFKHEYQIRVIIDNSFFSKHLEEQNLNNEILFIKPKDIQGLIAEISNINFGIFVDSGPLHLANIFDKKGLLVETSVSNEILLSNTNKIIVANNKYKSSYCHGPCGLVDIFSYKTNIGCYETSRISFKNIQSLGSLKNLQRWNKKDNKSDFIMNPVGCIKNIDIKNIIELIKINIKEHK